MNRKDNCKCCHPKNSSYIDQLNALLRGLWEQQEMISKLTSVNMDLRLRNSELVATNSASLKLINNIGREIQSVKKKTRRSYEQRFKLLINTIEKEVKEAIENLKGTLKEIEHGGK